MAANDEFPALKNDLAIRAARGQHTERVPVWVMRQAGRYLPEYREIKDKHTFLEICRTPNVACEVTLQPIRRYGMDAAIIFSDILVIPIALGMEVDMIPGPVFKQPLRDPTDVDSLCFDNDKVMDGLDYVFQAISYTRRELNGEVPLIGFSGAPWTLMSYMIEGGSSAAMCTARSWLYAHPETSLSLLQRLCDVIVEYLVGQVKAGAQMLQVFESHAGMMDAEMFRKFSLPFLAQIASRVKAKLREQCLDTVPMIVFAKDAHYAVADLDGTEYDVIGLDWTVDPSAARTLTDKCLQGNLDPCALYGSRDSIREAVANMMDKFGTQNYIANLGHGIDKGVDPDKLKVFVDAIRDVSERINAPRVADKSAP